MGRAYLAGPMTGISGFNFPAFRDACLWLRQRGWDVVSPHEIDHGETDHDRGSLPHGVYLRASLAALLTCNAVVAVRFKCGPFGRFVPPPGAVVYCDPPYAGTTAYSSTGQFDYREFYRTLQQWAQARSVYVSEYAVPEDVPVKVVWERERRNALKKDDNQRVTLERLFRILPDARMSPGY